MDESLGHLLHKKRSVRHFEFNVSFQGFICLLNNGHVLLRYGLRHFSLLSQRSSVANDCGGALNSLLKSVLLDESVNFDLEVFFLGLLLFLHLLPPLCDVSLVLLGG